MRFLYKTNIGKIRKKFVLKTEKKIEQKIARYIQMKNLLAGLEKLTALPNMVVLFTTLSSLNKTEGSTGAPAEAFNLMIPIISIVNTGVKANQLNRVSFPIFGNDYLFDSLFFYGNLMLQSIRAGSLQKRLLFLKHFQTASLIQLPKKQKMGKKSIKVKAQTVFRNYRTYKAVAVKKIIRKTAFFVSYKVKN